MKCEGFTVSLRELSHFPVFVFTLGLTKGTKIQTHRRKERSDQLSVVPA